MKTAIENGFDLDRMAALVEEAEQLVDTASSENFSSSQKRKSQFTNYEKIDKRKKGLTQNRRDDIIPDSTNAEIFNILISGKSAVKKIKTLLEEPTQQNSYLKNYLDEPFEQYLETGEKYFMHVFRERVLDIVRSPSRSVSAMRFLLLQPSEESCYLARFFNSLARLGESEKKEYAVAIIRYIVTSKHGDSLEWLGFYQKEWIEKLNIIDNCKNTESLMYLQKGIKRQSFELQIKPRDTHILSATDINNKIIAGSKVNTVMARLLKAEIEANRWTKHSFPINSHKTRSAIVNDFAESSEKGFKAKLKYKGLEGVAMFGDKTQDKNAPSEPIEEIPRNSVARG